MSCIEINRDCTYYSLCKKYIENDIILEKPLTKKRERNHPNCMPSKTFSTHNENTKGLKIVGVEYVSSKNCPRTLNQIVLKDLVNCSSLIKLNEQYIEIKFDKFFCKMCKVYVCFDEYNGKYLQHHLFYHHNDLLVKHASDFISKETTGLGCNITNVSGEFNKFCLVKQKIAMDKKFVSHLMFIESNGQDFVCVLCKDIITFTTCGKYVESHFYQTHHLKKTYEISVSPNLANKKTDQNSKAKKSKTKNKKFKAQGDITVETFFNTGGLKLQPLIKKVDKDENCSSKLDPQVSVMGRRMFKALRLASENIGFRINSQFLTVQDENIFCTACQQCVIVDFDYNTSYWLQTLRHCFSQAHNEILIKNASDYLVSHFKRDCLKQVESDLTLHHFFELVDKVKENDPHDVTASHLLFLTTTINTNFSTGPSLILCHLCNKSIEFTVSAVEDHFLSYQHKKKTYELNCKSVPDSSPTNHCDQPLCSNPVNALLAGVLDKVSNKCEEVKVNKMFISFIENHFFCNICQEVVIFSDSGSFLKIHCLNERHNEILLKNALSIKKTWKFDQTEEDEKILCKMFALINNSKPYHVITSHAQFITVKNQYLFCLLCRQHINPVIGREIMKPVSKHFKSYLHGIKVYELNCLIYSTFTPVEPDHNLLTQLDSPKTNCPTVEQHENESGVKELAADKNACKIELMIGTATFESVSPEIQKCITKNLDHLEMRGNCFYCGVCNLELHRKKRNSNNGIKLSGLSSIISHLNGKLHRRTNKQQDIPKTNSPPVEQHENESGVEELAADTNACKIELMIGTATFESVSSEIQKCISKNLDHLEMRGNCFYCGVCYLVLHRKKRNNKGATLPALNQMVIHFNGKRHRKITED